MPKDYEKEFYRGMEDCINEDIENLYKLIEELKKNPSSHTTRSIEKINKRLKSNLEIYEEAKTAKKVGIRVIFLLDPLGVDYSNDGHSNDGTKNNDVYIG